MADVPSIALTDVHGFYDDSHVLHGLSLEVARGEAVSIIGRNGAGKTTTMRAIMGLLDKRSGSIRVKGQEVIAAPPERIARLGIGYVPEERGIFATLTVAENLTLPPVTQPGGMSIADIHALFPNLKGRDHTPGTRLSGGEQQMLAIARILRTGADFILLDEPTEGLAPVIVAEIGAALQVLKKRGFTILLVEQNLHFASSIADRHYVMEQGVIVDEVANHALAANLGRLQSYLGV